MRVRIAMAGVMAGAICFVALYVQYYRFGPADFVPGWPYAIQAAILPPWTSTVVTLFCAVTLFSFGWVAARWNWAETWQASVLAGAGAGTIAGCLAYGMIGIFWYGIQGQAAVLKNFYEFVTEADGTRIVVEAIFLTGHLVYMRFIQSVPACVLLGAFGGLASALVDVKDVWGRRPRAALGWLLRLSAYLLVIGGVLNLIVTIAIMSTLWEKAINSGTELQKQYGVTVDLEPQYGFFIWLAYLAGLLFTLLPAGLTWGWILRAWKQSGKPQFLSLLWLVITVTGAGYYTYKIAAGMIDLTFGGGGMFTFALLLPAALVATLCVGTLAGFMAAEPLGTESLHRSGADWSGFLLSYGILGGTQIMLGAPALALPLTLITITNIPHLVSAGLVEKSPVEQVMYLFRFQVTSLEGLMVISMILGLLAAGLVSLFRSLLGIRDLPASH